MPEQEHLIVLVACGHEKLMTLKPSLPVVLFPSIYRRKGKPVSELLWFAKLDSGQCSKYLSKCCCIYVQVTLHHDKLRIKQPTRCIKYPTFILS